MSGFIDWPTRMSEGIVIEKYYFMIIGIINSYIFRKKTAKKGRHKMPAREISYDAESVRHQVDAPAFSMLTHQTDQQKDRQCDKQTGNWPMQQIGRSVVGQNQRLA